MPREKIKKTDSSADKYSNAFPPLRGGERRRKGPKGDLFEEVKRNEVLKNEGQSGVRTFVKNEQMLLRERRRKGPKGDLFEAVKRNAVLKDEGQSGVRTFERYEQMLLRQGEASKVKHNF